MPTWLELDQQFRELQPALRHYRLDFQWGAAGIYYRLAGGGTNDATRRFETLARIAGVKLQELPAGVLHEDVMQRGDPMECWYEALKHHAGGFEPEHAGSQHDADGTFMGYIFSGTVYDPLSASGVLALQLSAVPIPAAPVPVERPKGVWSGINAWLANQAKEHGYLWLVGATVVGLVLTALAL